MSKDLVFPHRKRYVLKKIIAAYSENHTALTNTLCGQKYRDPYFEAGGVYSNHRTLNDKTSVYCDM
jgi:hypothetical protein